MAKVNDQVVNKLNPDSWTYSPCFDETVFCALSHREQRQKEPTKTTVVNTFPKDRDYRREAMQASAATGFTGASKFLFVVFLSFLCFAELEQSHRLIGWSVMSVVKLMCS
jgi:hypothetical protein